ncbi:hypothetical protein U0070_009479 [Myodes glareolus]|uniref:Protein FMC1 homolog n=1 Tax=Myodes glareolus TaxID=447135 RepID=A0AAW0I922_MYOGA
MNLAAVILLLVLLRVLYQSRLYGSLRVGSFLCQLYDVTSALHQEFHGKGERSVEKSAGLVGLQLPHQPGGKGWEP